MGLSAGRVLPRAHRGIRTLTDTGLGRMPLPSWARWACLRVRRGIRTLTPHGVGHRLLKPARLPFRQTDRGILQALDLLGECLEKLVRSEGFEPPASALGGRRSFP